MKMQVTVDGVSVLSNLEVEALTFAELRISIAGKVDALNNKTWHFVCSNEEVALDEEALYKVSELCKDGKVSVVTTGASSASASSASPALQPAASPAAQPVVTSAPAANAAPTVAPAAATPAAATATPTARTKVSQEARLQSLVDTLAAQAPTNLKGSQSPLNTSPLRSMIPGIDDKSEGAMQSLQRLSLIDHTLLNGNLPVAIAFDNGMITQKRDAVKIIPEFSGFAAAQRKAIGEFFLGERLAWFPNHGSDIVRAFQSESLMTLHQSSALHLAFDASGNATIDGVSLEAKRSASWSSTNESMSSKGEKTFFVSMIREEPIIEMKIPRMLIEVPSDVQIGFDRQLSAFERDIRQIDGANKEALEAARSALVREMQRTGILVPQIYTVGGRLNVTEIDTTSVTRDASEVSARTNFKNAAEANVPGLGGGRVETGIATDNSNASSLDEAAKKLLVNMQGDGGDRSARSQHIKWKKSLDDYSLLALIGNTQPIPIWEFFDKPLRAKFEKHLPVSYLTDFFKRNFKAGLEQHNIYETLQADARALANVSFTSWDLQPHEVSMKFGLPLDNLPGSKPLYKGSRSEDYALIGPLKREHSIKADDGYVISYLSMTTVYNPPGQWHVRSGGLLQNAIKIEMEANSLRGFSWSIEVHQIKKELVVDSLTYMDDFICYKAMKFAPDEES